MEGRPHVIMYTRNTVKALVRLEACRFPSFPKACGGHPGCRGFNERRGVEWAAQAENVRVLTPPGRPKLLSADTRQRDDPCYHTHASLPGEPRGRYAYRISDGTDGKKKNFLRLRWAWKLEQAGGALQPEGGATGGSQGCSQLMGLRAVSLQLRAWFGVDSATECPCRVSGFLFCTETRGTVFTEDACANTELVSETTGFP